MVSIKIIANKVEDLVLAKLGFETILKGDPLQIEDPDLKELLFSKAGRNFLNSQLNIFNNFYLEIVPSLQQIRVIGI